MAWRLLGANTAKPLSKPGIAIIRTNAGILLIDHSLVTKLIEIWNEIQTFLFKKTHFKMSGKWHPFCLGLKMLSLIYTL